MLSSQSQKHQPQKLPEYKSKYPEFPFMRQIGNKCPEINDLIISYVAPRDLEKWSPAIDNETGTYGYDSAMIAATNLSLAQSWTEVYNQFLTQKYGSSTPLAPVKKDTREQFVTAIKSEEAVIKNIIMQDSGSKQTTEALAARNYAFFYGQFNSESSGNLLMEIITDARLEDQQKAKAVRNLLGAGADIRHLSVKLEPTLKYICGGDACCDRCEPITLAKHCCGLACALCLGSWGLVCVTKTHCQVCYCLDLCTPNPVTWTPMLAATLHAGVNTIEVVAEFFPQEIMSTQSALDHLSLHKDYKNLQSPDNLVELKVNFMKATKITEDKKSFLENYPLRLENTNTLSQCQDLYNELSRNPVLEQRNANCCSFFCRSSAYPSHKIEFIQKIQQKLLSLLAQQQAYTMPRDYLDLHVQLLNHAAFDANHSQHGVSNQYRNVLLHKTGNVRAFLNEDHSYYQQQDVLAEPPPSTLIEYKAPLVTRNGGIN